MWQKGLKLLELKKNSRKYSIEWELKLPEEPRWRVSSVERRTGRPRCATFVSPLKLFQYYPFFPSKLTFVQKFSWLETCLHWDESYHPDDKCHLHYGENSMEKDDYERITDKVIASLIVRADCDQGAEADSSSKDGLFNGYFPDLKQQI